MTSTGSSGYLRTAEWRRVCEERKEMEGETVKNLDLGFSEIAARRKCWREREKIVKERERKMC